MKRLGLLALLLMAGLAWGQNPAWAKRYQKDPASDTVIEESRRTNGGKRWQELSPEQRKKLKQRYRQFQKLPPEEQQKLRQRYERFRDLSPEKKQRMLERHRRLQQLTPQQRERLQQDWQRIQKLPPEERRQLRKELRRQYFNGNNGGNR